MPRVLPLLLTAAGVAAAAQLTRAAWGLPAALGASRRRIAPVARTSRAFDGTAFRNRMPSEVVGLSSLPAMLRQARAHRGQGKPARPIPVGSGVVPVEAGDLAVTWFGHASALIEIDGARILADPVWGDRVSPSAVVGPHRMHPVPPGVAALPTVDAVLLSHDHYDHLDLPTVRTLLHTQQAPFVVPAGIGAHLRGWGVPEDRIVELDWDGEVEIAGITLTCVEARHFSGRGLSRNTTLWSSWALRGPRHTVFFGGDTGYHPGFAEIGARFGGFDVTLMPVGAYGPQWPDIHLDPEEAWRAHGDLGGRTFVPIHWGTFDLAFHTWSEPIERLLTAAGEDRRSTIVVPRPGERFDVLAPADPGPWWREIA
ncbi:hypothetical protein GIS00_17540 [Nakamurella sp. YIM 132087]|uniref:Metallo-beta-lactamase domain-containing protein n=1 Tax=Nakamurella alba TaxID=2665158 RepID=A0A7K1FNT2_9ACTN|nr:MBL fold metallo-hydrolase [Nakamurella alba]MTD15740.1 hypothetical protein [Nakamurella alba]